MGMAFPLFQQFAGNDAIAFYGTFLFKIAGFGDQAALYSAIITGTVGFVSVCTTVFLVDRYGRKPLLLGGASIMIISMVVLAIIFATGLPGNTQKLPHVEAILEVFFLCCFIVAFLSSIGPLAWLIPSEIYPLEVRSAGLSVTVCVNMLFKFLIAQTFLSMLCTLKYGVFLFFGGWMVVMIIFVAFFFPETKGIPIDGMQELWITHWFWKRFVPFDNATKYHDLDKNQL